MKRNTISMFPRAAFAPLEHHFQPWFAEHLRILEEPPLHTGVDRLTLRFLWLRTYSDPVVVSLSGPPWELRATTSRGLAGPDARRISYREIRSLDTQRSTSLRQHFRAIEFWFRPDAPQPRTRCGGDHWLLEAATRSRYRLMRMYAPPEHDAVRRFCLALLEPTQVPLPSTRIVTTFLRNAPSGPNVRV